MWTWATGAKPEVGLNKKRIGGRCRPWSVPRFSPFGRDCGLTGGVYGGYSTTILSASGDNRKQQAAKPRPESHLYAFRVRIGQPRSAKRFAFPMSVVTD